jgi:rubrerythrin
LFSIISGIYIKIERQLILIIMAKWRCTVCDWETEADEPPEECPVCGADKSAFEKVG